MHKSTLKRLNLTEQKFNEILQKKPKSLCQVYWRIGSDLFFIRGHKRNALVYCDQTQEWLVSSRRNTELRDKGLFLILPVLDDPEKNSTFC